jgi:hypothetical protein
MLAGFLLFGVVSIVAWKKQANRLRQLERVAAANGFTFSTEDLWASARVPFQIFRLGNRGHAENVLLGTAADGAPARVFDFASWEERETEDGVQRYRHRRFTCCLTEVDASFPHLVLQPETLATRVLGRLGAQDLEFESEEFNRRFTVTSEDERFARLLVDPQMMELLLSTAGEVQVELRGRWLLLATTELPARLCLSLVGLATAVRQRIPGVVWQHYPPLSAVVEP